MVVQSQTMTIPRRYLLVSWLFVLSAIAYLDRTNISIAGLAIGSEFHVNNTRLGWVFSAFLIGYAVCQVPAGLVVHRFGSRQVLAFAAGWWAVFTVLTAVVPPGLAESVLLLVLVRLGLGVGEAAMYPATSHFVERWFPAGERGRANGIIFAGVGAGSGLTPPLVTAIIAAYGWRASFWFSAAVGLAAGTIWYVIARDCPPHPVLTSGFPHAVGSLGVDEASPNVALSARLSRASWMRVLWQRDVLALTVSYFTFGYVAWVFFAWFYIYLAQVRGLNLKASALYSTLPFLCMTVGCLGGGALSDALAIRFGRYLGRCVLSAAMMSLTAVLLLVGSAADSAQVAGLVLAAGAGTLYIGQSSFWAVGAEVGGEYSSVTCGLMNMGAQIGGAVTASLTPIIAAHYGWHVPFVVAAGLALLGAGCWLCVRRA